MNNILLFFIYLNKIYRIFDLKILEEFPNIFTNKATRSFSINFCKETVAYHVSYDIRSTKNALLLCNKRINLSEILSSFQILIQNNKFRLQSFHTGKNDLIPRFLIISI